MFCQEVVVVFMHRCVTFIDVFLREFSCSCIDFVYALLACRYIIKCSPLRSLYFEKSSV
jgi:hypothetical protein